MKKHLKTYFILATSVLAFSSCLKDDAFEDDKTGLQEGTEAHQVVELPYQTHSLTQAITLVDELQDLKILDVNVAQKATLSQDLTVSLDTTGSYQAIHQYNEDNDAEYEKLPDALYTMSSLDVVIPAGSKRASLIVKLNPSSLDPAVTYALQFKIAKISSSSHTISSNFDYVFVTIGVKNKYDAVYTVTGSYQDLSFPVYSGYYPKEIQLRTVNASTVLYFDDHDLGSAGYVFNTGTALSYYGNWAPQFVFDTATDAVTAVTNYYGQGTNSSLRSGQLDATGVNKYDAAAKTIDVKYMMIQGGAERIKVSEKFTFKEAR